MRLAFAVGASLALTSAAMAQERARAARSPEWLDASLHWITRAIEVGGIAVILVGAIAATATYLRTRRTDPERAYHLYRVSLGRAILLGLEFLVAADIIGTVAIEPTLEGLAVLGGIVVIRTFLSISLEVEIEGRWPWRRARAEPGDGRRDRAE